MFLKQTYILLALWYTDISHPIVSSIMPVGS